MSGIDLLGACRGKSGATRSPGRQRHGVPLRAPALPAQSLPGGFLEGGQRPLRLTRSSEEASPAPSDGLAYEGPAIRQAPAGLRPGAGGILDPRTAGVRPLRIGLAQINVTVGDVEGNTRRVLAEISRARALGVALPAFPAPALPRYAPDD